MIIDYTQKKDGVDISYINDNNQIEIITVPLTHGYYKYVACENFDNSAIENLVSFKNKSKIKRETTKYFNNHNINEFLNNEIKVEHPNIFEKISKLKMPNPFSIDIETEITAEFGYSTPEKVENKILSISITDINLETIYFCLENKDKPKISLEDFESIKNIVSSTLGEHKDKYNFGFQIRIFKSETEMLNVFLECINKFFHSQIGWNFTMFDWLYITNRCKKLGIDIKKASPIHKITKQKFVLKDKSEVVIDFPTHRVIIDYMTLFKESLIYNNLDSYSLDNISSLILKLNKVSYTGNLKTLYETDFNKFIAYALIDTILVMLIHKSTNLYDVDFFESYFNGIPFAKISQNSISEALIYNELRNENIFLLESEFNNVVKRSYQGGYVKTPTKKIIDLGLGVDFSGLYPNSMITNDISPENKIDKLLMDNFGKPLNEKELKKWMEYKDMGFTLTPFGTIYNGKTDGVFVRVEKKLIKQRKIFKGHAEDLYLNVIPKIENLIKQKQ